VIPTIPGSLKKESNEGGTAMKSPCVKPLSLSLILVVCAVCLQAQKEARSADAPKIVGTWKLNLAKTTFAGAPLKSRTLKWEWDGETLKHTAETVDAKGTQTVARFNAKSDGKDYPVFENGSKSPLRYVRMKLLNPYQIEITSRKDGKDLTTFRHTISNDNKTDTITQTGQTVAGEQGKEVLVYDRQ
jgi:hypothetical protein